MGINFINFLWSAEPRCLLGPRHLYEPCFFLDIYGTYIQLFQITLTVKVIANSASVVLLGWLLRHASIVRPLLMILTKAARTYLTNNYVFHITSHYATS